jgi:hypothetical protein
MLKKYVSGCLFVIPYLSLVSCAAIESKPETPEVISPFSNQYSAAVHFIQPLFSVLDCEKVGEIEKGEIDEHFHELFFFADRDQSRTITLPEYSHSVSHSTAQQDQYIFVQMDANADGVVDPNEFQIYLNRSIDAADLNQDGSVTEQEAQLHSFKRVSAKK